MAKLPGETVRGSKTGRPIMVLLDALGKRWTLRLLWELRVNGPGTFRQLQARCEDVSPTSLNSRLKELRELEWVELSSKGFALTPYGMSLTKLLSPLDKWAQQWGDGIAKD